MREIQTVLVRKGYLNGEPTGVWDQKTRDAMVHFQADNGWQTKMLPDSRALIKLGLGPNHSSAMNAEPLPASLGGGTEGAKGSDLPQNRQ